LHIYSSKSLSIIKVIATILKIITKEKIGAKEFHVSPNGSINLKISIGGNILLILMV